MSALPPVAPTPPMSVPTEPAAAPPRPDLEVILGGRCLRFAPGTEVSIGRSADSTVVIDDPVVSRHHAVVACGPDGWVLTEVSRDRTFLAGRPVRRVVVDTVMQLSLASPSGPTLRIGPAAPVGPGADPAPKPERRTGSGPWQPPTRDELTTALQILLPIKSWLKEPGWRQGLRLGVIIYALLPLAFIAMFAGSVNLTTPGWAYSLYIAPLWGYAFWWLIRPGAVKKPEVRIGIAIILWVLVWMDVVTVKINGHLGTPDQPLSLIAAIGVGYNEEITKALPVLLAALLLMRWKSKKLDVRMWMFLGTIAGLTFGVVEQAAYTSQALVGIARAQGNNDAVVQVLQFAERVFVDGFQHAVWAGISAFFVGMAVNYPRRRVGLVAFGVTLTAVLHGLNDWIGPVFNSLWAQVAVQGLSLVLFLGYTMSATSIERKVRHTPLFRGESILLDGTSRSASE